MGSGTVPGTGGIVGSLLFIDVLPVVRRALAGRCVVKPFCHFLWLLSRLTIDYCTSDARRLEARTHWQFAHGATPCFIERQISHCHSYESSVVRRISHNRGSV